MNEVAFELGFERWVGLSPVEMNLLGEGSREGKAFRQEKFPDVATTRKLFPFVVLEGNPGYDALNSN